MILNVVPAIRRISLPRIKRFAGIIMAAFFICMFLSVPALATGYRLNSGGPQVVTGSLSMAGSRVIWADNRTGTKQIYVKDLAASGAETPVQTTLNNQVTPAISGSIVVWQENSDLYYKDLSGGSAVQLTDNGATYPKRTPAIYGNRVVWSEDHGTRDLVYTKLLTDAGNGTAVDTIDTTLNQTAPAVSADYIIWTAGSTLTGITDLRIKKTTSIMYGPADFCTATGSQLNPKISGNLVAWEDTSSTLQGFTISSEGVINPPYGLMSGISVAYPAVTGGPMGDFLVVSDDVFASPGYSTDIYGWLWSNRIFMPLVVR